MKTFRYIIVSSILMLCITANLAAQAEQTEKETATKPKETVDTIPIPLFQGLFLEFDIAPFVESTLINKYAYTYQGNAMFNLKNKYFPVVEVGFGGAENTNSAGASFKTSGMFEKIGIDFRLIRSTNTSKTKYNLFLGGVRFGMSHFNYSLTDLSISNDYWGGTQEISNNSLAATKIWLEFVAGMRVSIYKNIYMGWNVRNKRMIIQDKVGEPAPWYIPGFGINKSPVWGFSYIIGYRF